jgi:hypothetical protein
VADARNTRLIAHIDCPGGGQVWVDGTTLYIGHMRAPSGTTIVDVADPRAPKIIAHVELPQGWHSHKAIDLERDGKLQRGVFDIVLAKGY